MTKHLTSFLARSRRASTPQSEPMPGTSQVPNSAGGYAFAVDEWTRLRRFLILGSEGGSYYATQRALTAENAGAVLRCLDLDGARAVREIVEISQSGRAPKNEGALFALALAASCDNDATRKLALAALPQVARTGTHLFHFAAFVDAQRGWGRGLRAAIGRWYSEKSPRDLAYQTLKYQARDGWSHRDLLCLAHPTPQNDEQQIIFHWNTQGWPGVGSEVHPVEAVRGLWAFETLKGATDENEVARLVREFDLPREAIPTQWLTSPRVWEALLEKMPMTALIRNLATMTKIGLLTPGSAATARVVEQLSDATRLQRARASGRGFERAQDLRGRTERARQRDVDAGGQNHRRSRRRVLRGVWRHRAERKASPVGLGRFGFDGLGRHRGRARTDAAHRGGRDGDGDGCRRKRDGNRRVFDQVAKR